MIIEGDEIEDKQQFISYLKVNEYLSSIHEAQEQIRWHVKNNDISSEELKFLDSLRETLFIEE